MKKFKLKISQQAIEDLSDIWSYIALDNPNAADRFVEQLHESCKSLAKMPEMGRQRNELLLAACRTWILRIVNNPWFHFAA